MVGLAVPLAGVVVGSVLQAFAGGGLGIGDLIRSVARIVVSWARIAFNIIREHVRIVIMGIRSTVDFIRFRMGVVVNAMIRLGVAHARIFGRDPARFVAFMVFVRELVSG